MNCFCLDAVLVFYCSITNNHTPSKFKTTHIYFLAVSWGRSSGTVWLGPLLSCHTAGIKVGMGSVLIWSLDRGTVCCQSQVSDRNCFFPCGFITEGPSFLLAGGCSPILEVTLPHPAHRGRLQLQAAEMESYMIDSYIQQSDIMPLLLHSTG